MKATVSFLLMFTMMFVSVCPTYAQDNRVERVQDNRVERALVKAYEDAERTAIRDANGRVSRIEIEYFSPMQTLELSYDQDTLSSITLGDGTRMTILRNREGRFEGFVFPDGSKAIFLWTRVPDFDLNLPAGLKFISPRGEETVFPLTGSPRQKESALSSKIADESTDCQFAVAALVLAIAHAVLVCGVVPNLLCITATAAVALATANVVRACRGIIDPEVPPQA